MAWCLCFGPKSQSKSLFGKDWGKSQSRGFSTPNSCLDSKKKSHPSISSPIRRSFMREKWYDRRKKVCGSTPKSPSSPIWQGKDAKISMCHMEEFQMDFQGGCWGSSEKTLWLGTIEQITQSENKWNSQQASGALVAPARDEVSWIT